MNRFMISVFFISSFLISGCSTSGNQQLKKETSQSLQSKIIKNKTTKSEIITALEVSPKPRLHLIVEMKNGLIRWITISLMPPHLFPLLGC